MGFIQWWKEVKEISCERGNNGSLLDWRKKLKVLSETERERDHGNRIKRRFELIKLLGTFTLISHTYENFIKNIYLNYWNLLPFLLYSLLKNLRL